VAGGADRQGARAGQNRQRGMEDSVIGPKRRDNGEAAFSLRLPRVCEFLPGMELKPRQNVAFSTYIAGVPRIIMLRKQYV
jgi:hypothetical protein